MLLISQAAPGLSVTVSLARWVAAVRAGADAGFLFSRTFKLVATPADLPLLDGVQQAVPDGGGSFVTGGYATAGRAICPAEAEALADMLEDLIARRRIVLPPAVIDVLRAGGGVELA